jgi:hypothetical protein
LRSLSSKNIISKTSSSSSKIFFSLKTVKIIEPYSVSLSTPEPAP